MPKKYTVKNNETGQRITFTWEGDQPPNESDMEEIFSAAKEFKPQTPQEQPFEASVHVQEPSYLQRLGGYWTEDIPQAVTGAVERTKQRFQNIEKPTMLGSMATKKLGVSGLPREIVEEFAGKPEYLLRTAGAIGATVGEPAGVISELGMKSFGRWTGGKVDPEKAVGPLVGKILESKPVQKVIETWGKIPEAGQEDIKSIGGLLELGGIYKGIKLLDKLDDLPLEKLDDLSSTGKKLVKPLLNERGSIKFSSADDVIPDVDDVERAVEQAAQLPKKTSYKKIRDVVGEPPKRGIRNPLIADDEAMLLAQPELPGETPFPEVLKRAYSAKVNRLKGGKEALTPFEIAAAEKAVPALNKLDKMRREVGKIKGDIIQRADDYLIETSQFADATPIQNKFNQLLRDSYGAIVDKSGRLKDAPGMMIRDTADKPTIQKMYRIVNKLRKETTLSEIDNAITDLRNVVEHQKVSQFRQMNTIAEGIGKNIREDLKKLRISYIEDAVDWGGADDFLGASGVEKLKKSIVNYDRYSRLEDRLNRMLGQVTDAGTGVPQKGASAMKAALVSNARGENKGVFQLVKDITGIDLQREAAKAEVAMRAVGDTRADDMLKDLGIMKDVSIGSKYGAIAKLGQKGVEKFTGDKPDQLLRYYYKMQKKKKIGDLLRED